MYYREKIVNNIMVYDNLLVQRISPNHYQIHLIDNLGTNATIPIVFYIDFLTRLHVKKKWHIFLEMLRKDFPHIMTDELYYEFS